MDLLYTQVTLSYQFRCGIFMEHDMEHMIDNSPADKGIKADGKKGGLEARLMIIGIAMIAVIAAIVLVVFR